MRDDLKALLGFCCALAAAGISAPAMAQQQQQEPLGRLFFTPAQRSSLDVARSQRARATLSTEGTEEQQAAPAEQTITYGGMVRRSDGKSTVWINGRPVNDGQPAPGTTIVGKVGRDGSVSVEAPQTGRRVELKPGQSLELLSGTIEEGYSRRPAQPETKPAAKPPAEAKGEKAATAEAGATDRDSEDRQRKIDELLRAAEAAAAKGSAGKGPPVTSPSSSR